MKRRVFATVLGEKQFNFRIFTWGDVEQLFYRADVNK